MSKKLSYWIGALLLAVLHHFSLSAQTNPYLGDISQLYAETKQVNQFFRRFNAEEAEDGAKIETKNNRYRSKPLRQKFLPLLFDAQNTRLTSELKNEFMRDVLDKNQFLDFFSGDWFAEVEAKFTNPKGQEETAIIFLKIQKEPIGSKWVMKNAYYEPAVRMFYQDTLGKDSKFLHPLSHELDFMNLNKVFSTPADLEYYAPAGYRPDFLSIFFYEVKKRQLQFRTISNVKFHFFHIKDWYFEISEFNRASHNSGWLISNLSKVPDAHKPTMIQYIYRTF